MTDRPTTETERPDLRAALERAESALSFVIASESEDRHWFEEAVSAREQAFAALTGAAPEEERAP